MEDIINIEVSKTVNIENKKLKYKNWALLQILQILKRH